MPLPDRMKHLPVDERGYPIIATIPQTGGAVDFGIISEERKLVLAAYDLCGVCATPFAEDDLRWQAVFPAHPVYGAPAEVNPPDLADGLIYVEAPSHRICVLYAAQVCPFVASPYARMGNGERRGLRRGETLTLLGFRSTADVLVHESDIQPGLHVLAHRMDGLAERIDITGAAQAQAAYRAALEADSPVEVDETTQTLMSQLTRPAVGYDHEDAGAVLGGAVMSIGGVFLDGIEDLAGFRDMAHDTIRVLSLHAAENIATVTAQSMDEPYIVAAHAWVAAHYDSLPPLLRTWHERARCWARRQRSGGVVRPPAPVGRRGAPKRSVKNKAQRTARRKSRR